MRSVLMLCFAILAGCNAGDKAEYQSGYDAGFQKGFEAGRQSIIGDAQKVLSLQDKADQQTAKTQLDGLANAIKLYRIDLKALPKSLQELVQRPTNVPDNEQWTPYFPKAIPLDPWGNEYVYRSHEDDRSFSLFSVGPDAKAGTADDIAYNR